MRNAKSQMGNLTFANLIDFSNYVLFLLRMPHSPKLFSPNLFFQNNFTMTHFWHNEIIFLNEGSSFQSSQKASKWQLSQNIREEAASYLNFALKNYYKLLFKTVFIGFRIAVIFCKTLVI